MGNSQKKAEWPITIWKDLQSPEQSGEWKLKQQWDAI